MLAANQLSASGNLFGQIDIGANYSGLLIVKILDVQGRLAKVVKETVTESVQKLSLNITDLKNGIYVMNIVNDYGFIKSIRYTKM